MSTLDKAVLCRRLRIFLEELEHVTPDPDAEASEALVQAYNDILCNIEEVAEPLPGRIEAYTKTAKGDILALVRTLLRTLECPHPDRQIRLVEPDYFDDE